MTSHLRRINIVVCCLEVVPLKCVASSAESFDGNPPGFWSEKPGLGTGFPPLHKTDALNLYRISHTIEKSRAVFGASLKMMGFSQIKGWSKKLFEIVGVHSWLSSIQRLTENSNVWAFHKNGHFLWALLSWRLAFRECTNAFWNCKLFKSWDEVLPHCLADSKSTMIFIEPCLSVSFRSSEPFNPKFLNGFNSPCQNDIPERKAWPADIGRFPATNCSRDFALTWRRCKALRVISRSIRTLKLQSWEALLRHTVFCEKDGMR